MDRSWMLEEYDGIVYVSDLETYELKYMNRTGCRMFGTTQEAILQDHKTCYEVLQGRNAPCPFCNNHSLEETRFHEWENYNPVLNRTLLLKDRKFLWKGREARIEFATDISEYREKIRSKEWERNAVLRTLPGGIVRIDARDLKTVLWYGANFLSMIGYTHEQFVQELHSQSTYIHPDDAEENTRLLASLEESRKTVITELRIVTRNGDVRTLTTTFSYEDGDASEDGIPSIYSLGIDITEAKQQQELQQRALEEAYQAARMANSAKTDFLSSMSHDIRTPMNAILGMTAIAAANLTDPARVSDCLKKINNSSRHLLGLINEVLDMSKIESGKVDLVEEAFDLPQLVQNVMDMCRPLLLEKQHEIRVNIGNVHHEKLLGDMERLQQVFVNLLSNAVKYTPSGGLISVSIREKPLRVPDASLFEFVFEDNGIGMSQEFLKHIFEPFSRAEDSRINKIQGTGLGMPISENIIHMMNGTIRVESEMGKGTCFTVNVPLRIQAALEDSAVELMNLPVLVADDDQDVCECACLVLEDIGMEGHWVTTGREAVDEAVRAHEAGEDYFAVILDWKMPGMDGLEAASAIRTQVGPDLPIIIVSAYDYSEIEADLVAAGVDAFITKPMFKSKLLQVFHQFTGNRPLEVPKSESSITHLAGKRLLLAEDNELNREIAQELLQMAGALVESAENGREAVERFASSPPGHFDLILMDVQMPLMNGYDAASAIRAMDRPDVQSMPILALTANAFSEDILAAKRSGMNEHISKPIDAETMYQIIGKWLP